ncbi:hypothetical protein TARUN_9607 [Trichoderma arundinaceum]|uniref:Uncharacterized protein n=1 Tax=Trichoderma arundinaceum TaxID=490622 RepID=A0A395NA08_TRIAR|nr:hypothetical protein TARUN_9607 [Trichoderma arundinaceum]
MHAQAGLASSGLCWNPEIGMPRPQRSILLLIIASWADQRTHQAWMAAAGLAGYSSSLAASLASADECSTTTRRILAVLFCFPCLGSCQSLCVEEFDDARHTHRSGWPGLRPPKHLLLGASPHGSVSLPPEPESRACAAATAATAATTSGTPYMHPYALHMSPPLQRGAALRLSAVISIAPRLPVVEAPSTP